MLIYFLLGGNFRNAGQHGVEAAVAEPTRLSPLLFGLSDEMIVFLDINFYQRVKVVNFCILWATGPEVGVLRLLDRRTGLSLVISSQGTLDGELMSGPLSSPLVVFILILVDGLDVASKVVVGEVLAAELTGVAQFHQLSPPFSLFVFFLVSLELGSSDFFATLTHDSSKLEPIKEFNDSIMAFLGLFSLTFR